MTNILVSVLSVFVYMKVIITIFFIALIKLEYAYALSCVSTETEQREDVHELTNHIG